MIWPRVWKTKEQLLEEYPMATDKQLIQKIVADYYKQRSIEQQCMICTDTGLGMCELHEADECTEVWRQAMSEPTV